MFADIINESGWEVHMEHKSRTEKMRDRNVLIYTMRTNQLPSQSRARGDLLTLATNHNHCPDSLTWSLVLLFQVGPTNLSSFSLFLTPFLPQVRDPLCLVLDSWFQTIWAMISRSDQPLGKQRAPVSFSQSLFDLTSNNAIPTRPSISNADRPACVSSSRCVQCFVNMLSVYSDLC